MDRGRQELRTGRGNWEHALNTKKSRVAVKTSCSPLVISGARIRARRVLILLDI
jgi:hypothetical protein